MTFRWVEIESLLDPVSLEFNSHTNLRYIGFKSYTRNVVNELVMVIEKAAKLSDREQQVLASILEQELEDEEAWNRRFESSPETLEMLVKRAKAQYESGVCTEDF